MCTLRANYVKEGGDLQTEENTLYAENCAQLVYKVGYLCDLQKCVCHRSPVASDRGPVTGELG